MVLGIIISDKNEALISHLASARWGTCIQPPVPAGNEPEEPQKVLSTKEKEQLQLTRECACRATHLAEMPRQSFWVLSRGVMGWHSESFSANRVVNPPSYLRLSLFQHWKIYVLSSYPTTISSLQLATLTLFFKRWVPDHLTWLLISRYAGQEATIRTGHGKKKKELDMEQQTGSKSGKEYVKAVYCHPACLIYMQSTSCEMPGWMKHKLESRLPGEISITSDMQMTPPLWQKVKKN